MEFRKYKLGACLTMIENGAVIKQKKGAGGIPITRIETLSNDMFNRDRLGYADIYDITKFSHYILDDMDLIMSHINSRAFLGRTVIYRKYMDEKIIHGMNVLRLKTNKNVLNPIYAYYYFKTTEFRTAIDHIRKDAINQSSLATSDIKQIDISIPSIDDQNAIVSVLSNLDHKIALNRSVNQNLEAFITDTTDYMFLSRMDELKKISIGEIALIKAGGDCPKDYTLSPNTINTIPIFSNGTENEGLYGYTSQAVIDGRSITVAARGTIGYCVRRYGKYVPIIRLLSVCPYDRGADTYLQQIISRMSFKKNGSVQQQLTVPELSIMQIPYPTKEELIKYDEITFPLIRQINQHKEENKALTKQRDELLPLLMNGQVTIE